MSDVSDTRDLVEEIENAKSKPFVVSGPHGRSYLVQPDGEGWSHFEIPPQPNEIEPLPPKIVTQAVQLQQVESLVAYVNKYKNEDSSIFADIRTSTILAIIDYHKPGEVNVGNHTKHLANLILPRALEWEIWTGADGKLMSHVDFANFLEENAADVMPLGQMRDAAGEMIEDAPSTLLELVRELQVKSSYGAASAIRNGDYVSIEMQKGDDVSTKRNIALPNNITLLLPVYFGEHPVMVSALVRRQVVDGSLRLGIKLVRPETVRQDEFKRIVGEIELNVSLATHYGRSS